ncbi:MAG: formate dehydrogenase accessory sulfurtransferase FdhD [Firmicutes bacterium]|nr:formate dehydrogenase accessory sulfurtransferase FdhD [Bacillota bacterium]
MVLEEEAVTVKRTAEKNITRIDGDRRELVADQVVIEAPLTIYLNGSELVTLLCTPEKIDYLALGFLRSEGFITAMDEIQSLRPRPEEGLVEVELKDQKGLEEKLFGKRTITSGCGKGTVFYNVLDSLRSAPLTGTLKISAARIWELNGELQKIALLFKTTGGVHSAALVDSEKLLYFHEDIGRHNAVDKIIGECLLNSTTTGDKALFTSGRLSSEILLKAAKLKIQLIVSRAAPTSLSVELAEALNITLVGFVRGRRMNIYSHPWRVF